MSAASKWKYLYYAYLSHPKSERPLYRWMRRLKPRRIVEVGVEPARRTRRLLQVAARFVAEPIHYAGIDLFDARPSSSAEPVTLKETHRLLKSLAARVRLLPGTPQQGLSAGANLLPDTDLLLITADHDEAALALAWFYVPRMLHAGSLVLREQPSAGGQTVWAEISRLQIEQLAAAATSKRRAA